MPGFPVLYYLLEFSDSCPLSQWCYLTVSSSASLFSSCLQSFPALESFPMNWLFASGSLSIGASASISFSPFSEYSGLISFRIDLSDLVAVQARNSKESSPTPQFKSIESSVPSLLYGPTLTSVHDHWKNHSFYYIDLCQQSDTLNCEGDWG